MRSRRAKAKSYPSRRKLREEREQCPRKDNAMPRKRAAPEAENHERWLVSYADFITLLFAFFVVMFASSQTDKARAKQMSESVKQASEDKHFPASVASILGGAADDKGKGNAQRKGPGGFN